MFQGFDFPALFSSFRNQKILIIGDVMIDTYLWGKVNRVSPEAPVPIVSGIMEENRLGGAANVALNVKALGAVPILCSVIGGDERGSHFLDLLEEQNLSDVGITVDDYRVTTQKTRVISGFKHLLRVDEEIDSNLSARVEEKFIEIVLNLMETGGISSIIIQDYDKGVLTPSVITLIFKLARKRKIPLMVDPKFRNFQRYKKVNIFKPNMKELIKGIQLESQTLSIEEIAERSEAFRKKQAIETLMVTLSSRGILVLDDSGPTHLPAVEREVTDVSGADDTVISVAAVCYNSNLSSAQIAAVANLAGGQVCERSGVVPVDREQLLKECKGFLLEKSKIRS
jgi:rfaE bifunctional protein kinase chain/domain